VRALAARRESASYHRKRIHRLAAIWPPEVVAQVLAGATALAEASPHPHQALHAVQALLRQVRAAQSARMGETRDA
jgi:hypothetical protein